METEQQVAPLKINLVTACRYLLGYRKYFYVLVPLVIIGVYLYTLSIPRYYKCNVKFAPEQVSTGSTIGSIISSFGFDPKLSGEDGLSPNLYPEILKTNEFLMTLLEIPVMDKEGVHYDSYKDFLLRDGNTSIMKQVKEFLGIKPKNVLSSDLDLSLFRKSFFIDNEMQKILDEFAGRISCRFDPSSITLDLAYTDYDPLVCAMMADTIMGHLQSFIITYRTSKARFDLDYTQTVYDEAKTAYEAASDAYARFCLANQNVVAMDYKVKHMQYENEMNIKMAAYSSLSSQLQLAKAKVQERIPTFTVYQSSTVPNLPAGPKRLLISLGAGIVAFFLLSMFLLRKHLRRLFS